MHRPQLCRLLSRVRLAHRKDLRMQVIIRTDRQERTVLRTIADAMDAIIVVRAAIRAVITRGTEMSAVSADSSSPEIIRAEDLRVTDLRAIEITDSREIPVPASRGRVSVEVPDRDRVTVALTAHPETEEMVVTDVMDVITAAVRVVSETRRAAREASVAMHL